VIEEDSFQPAEKMNLSECLCLIDLNDQSITEKKS